MLTEVLRYLFEHYDLNKVYCQTAGFNEPSVRLLEKFGFHRDATLREHHELDGVFYDDYIYSILKREFVGKCR
jgi:[ribosomal protein S5]-alanine N-acetyltransferase